MDDKKVKIYVTTYCGYCRAAEHFMDRHEIPYEAIDVTRDHDKRLWLVETTGMRTVPQIFIGTHPIGGFTDMRSLDSSGDLAPMLESEGIRHALG